MTNALEQALLAEVAADGPMPLDGFMRRALFDPEHGYYTTSEPFGVAGDFITAPEISQMFGELLGLWAADMWQKMGAPADIVLVEIGPGRGTLMADALRAIRRAAPGMLDTGTVCLVEASPRLRAAQAERLSDHAITFTDRLGKVPKGPMLLIGNELLDALPIRQITQQGGEMLERCIGVQDGALVIVDAPLLHEVPEDMPVLKDGDVFEVSEEGLRLVEAVGTRLAVQGGAALFIDYGHGESATGETLQAVRRHAFHPVLSDVGSADLTAHVDFAAMARAAIHGGARAWGPVSQRDLLRRLGVEPRLAQLVAKADPQTRDALVAAYHRLTDPDRMGTLFKALCLTAPDMEAPTAYETDDAFQP
ncbi:MAG: SAM-dependent methyltransferase [Minwuia sp.]|nr:SAM-dependent methyltransferase [Minwuia sp.]